MKETPFFIFGTKRGGTTLLRLMLSASPQIYIPKESHFLLAIFRRFAPASKLSKSEQYELVQLIEEGGRNTWDTTTPQLQEIVSGLPEVVPLSEIISAIYLHESSKHSPDIIGEKTPEYVNCIHDIRKLFPESKFIFIIRDARDVSDSLRARGWEGWTHYQRGVYWNSVVNKLLPLRDNNKNILVRYEDLVLAQEKILQQLSDFLEVAYSPKMLSFNDDFKSQLPDVEIERNIHKSIADTPNASHVAKWDKEGAKEEYFYLEKVCQANLQTLGYKLANTSVELERLGFSRKFQLQKYKILIAIYHVYHSQISTYLAQSLKSLPFFQKIRNYVRHG